MFTLLNMAFSDCYFTKNTTKAPTQNCALHWFYSFTGFTTKDIIFKFSSSDEKKKKNTKENTQIWIQ